VTMIVIDGIYELPNTNVYAFGSRPYLNWWP